MIDQKRKLKDALDELDKKYRDTTPRSISIFVHNSWVYHGVGANQSYVSVAGENGIAPAWIVEGDTDKNGIVSFLHHDTHHTEMQERYMVPADLARKIVIEFYETGERTKDVSWEQA